MKQIHCKKERHCRKTTLVTLLWYIMISRQLYPQSRMYLYSFCYCCTCINFIQHKTNGGRHLDFISRWCESSKVKFEKGPSLFKTKKQNWKCITSCLLMKLAFHVFPLDSLTAGPLEEKRIDHRNEPALLHLLNMAGQPLPLLFS